MDTGTLALFVGHATAALVQGQLAEQGFGDLRFSHGYVFQHLIDEEPTVGELAAHLAMTQQGASKAVAELERPTASASPMLPTPGSAASD
ncbi:helix-turn-helix domain-containing protein [Streptomyces antibioticus]|uniref:helix-turn-helix domain-containing protein n=1 Tax=Streptomyces antibioticus TaxID=1890 RepID=UPI003405E376